MFNQSTLKQLENDVGLDVLNQLMEVFRSESTKLTERLLECDELNDDTVRLSHSLKSCSRSYGADTLAELATLLESAAKAQSQEFFSLRESLLELHTKTMLEIPSA